MPEWYVKLPKDQQDWIQFWTPRIPETFSHTPRLKSGLYSRYHYAIVIHSEVIDAKNNPDHLCFSGVKQSSRINDLRLVPALAQEFRTELLDINVDIEVLVMNSRVLLSRAETSFDRKAAFKDWHRQDPPKGHWAETAWKRLRFDGLLDK